MKKLIMAAVVACALNAGARAEHVNLWPLYYSDGSSASIAWPLISYTDSTDWRVGTIYREHSEWGVFPFYMDFGSSIVVTPFVFAKDWSGGAILPLAYADFKGDDTFWTVFPAVYSHRWKDGENSTFWAAAGLAGRKVRGGETESHWLAPLWWRWPKERRGIFAAGLAGWDHLRDDEKCDWVLPFYWRNQDIFCSIPYGRIDESEKTTLNWWGLPLLQTRSGECRGFGIQPLFEYKRDKDFDAFERLLDADRLTDAPDDSSAEASLEWLLGLAGTEHIVRINPTVNNRIGLRETRSTGNELVLKRRRNKTVLFDATTRMREETSESGSSHFLGFVWNSDWRSENGEVVSSESSVLWRVWRSKLKDGHSTLDVFPWFSRESDQKGRTTTSFLWRFFCYENDPAKGSSLDLFFIPVWRE